MRSLKEYLVTEYMAQDLNDKLMIDNRIISSDITLQDLKDAGWGNSILDDKSWIVVDDQEFYKIKKDGWQKHSMQPSAISGVISSENLFKLIEKNKSNKGYVGELYLNNPHKIILDSQLSLEIFTNKSLFSDFSK